MGRQDIFDLRGIRRIYVAGHQGMAGSALMRAIEQGNWPVSAACEEVQLLTRTHAELDLTDQQAVRAFFQAEKPDAVILAAAKVGGIQANQDYPADFIYQNMMISSHVIHEAHAAGVQRLLQLGSSCIYPREATQPINEGALLTGALEPSNEPYAIAKIAAIKLCESYNRQYGRDYRSVMPCNLYGPGDNFHATQSHVIPALIRRFHEAVEDQSAAVALWGSGRAVREFLHVDDMARAALLVFALSPETYQRCVKPMQSYVNLGSGQEVSILDLARMIAGVTGFSGAITTDPDKPDGTLQKTMDNRLLQGLGWRPSISLEAGLCHSYEWYCRMRQGGEGLRH